MAPHRRTSTGALLTAVLLIAFAASTTEAQVTPRLMIRGREQVLHVYGPRTGAPVIVSSGDGGWIHLGPHVAEMLAARGFFVVGFDVRAYLLGFTDESAALRTSDVPADYRTLIAFAKDPNGRKPLLIGVSEGAGLSVLAATDAHTKDAIAGVIGVGLPELNELGWRWRDSLIYLTHRVPNEPTFSAAATVGSVAPVPLALVQSTHDEYVPLADTHRIFDRASTPKQLWLVESANHRFSDSLSAFDAKLMEAIEWTRQNQPQ